jgi:ketosteroid isomerase-like protein
VKEAMAMSRLLTIPFILSLLVLASAVLAKPQMQRHEIVSDNIYVDRIGNVDGTTPRVSKAQVYSLAARSLLCCCSVKPTSDRGIRAFKQEGLMKPAILVVTGLAVAMAACAPQGPAVDVAAETEALRATAARYNAAVEALDAAGMAAFYADDCRSMPPNEATLVGPAAMQAFVEEVSAIEGFAVALDPPDVVVGAGGDVGYTVGTVQITAPGPDGELATTNGRDVHIWRKEADGTWKLVIDIWNSETPFAEPEG